ncbi:MAG: hypothetical protein KBE09_01315 [Candidatus Pacebacteria bacterium]|nr:hypothetical protein [Candidatus Paceibacterota bacterium]
MKKEWILAAGFGLVVLAIGIALYLFVFAPRDVVALESYATLGEAHEDSAFLVGMSENPIRIELDHVLADVLMRPMTDDERYELSEQGRGLLKTLEVQIDAIGEKEGAAAEALASLQSSPLALSELTSIGEVVQLGTRRADLIADIRGLSYRANYHTAQIFERIMKDGGALTEAHVAALNSDLPLVEEQFDRRSNLYVELEKVSLDIQKSLETLK